MHDIDSVIEKLRQAKNPVVFGAGIVAYNVINCLLQKPFELKFDYCLVSDLKANPKEVMGIPVIDFHIAEQAVGKDTVILIAAVDKNLKPIQDILRSHGYLDTIPLTFHSDLWEQFREYYFREYKRRRCQPYLVLEDELQKTESNTVSADCESRTHIYAVKSHVDQKLREDISRYAWEIPIQAGTALTTKRVCEVCDNIGDNISEKNREYCELTALYWIWKNDVSDYVGLCHYRRHFAVNKTLLEKLAKSDIDVVLTIPILNFPNVRAVYENDHVIADWDIMLEAIAALAPDYMETACRMQEGNYYYGYNMFITRKSILDDYCAWLFPILSYCEKHCEKKADVYQNRYIGFLAERLLSIYFIHHEKNYKLVHAGKHFIQE